MSKGSTLFNGMFEDAPEVEKKQRGRDSSLIEQRNEKLLHRYFFYGHYTKYRTDYIYEQLMFEFDLTEERIFRLISKHSNAIKQLRNDPPTIKQLAEKYPFYNWSL